MNTRSVYFFITIAILLVALVAVATSYYLRLRRSQKHPYGNWESLLNRLAKLDRDNIAIIARDLIDDSGAHGIDENDPDLDPSQIWPMIGGLEGLERLQRNCAVLVDLVLYVQQWYPEALIVTEQMRQNAREIEWRVDRLKGVAETSRLDTFFPDHAQRAIATYYLMTRRLLALYERENLPGLSDLRRVL